jgi:chaperonin cofactor prefoldin
MTQVNRYSITLIVAAAIIIEVLGAAQYFMTRNGAKQEMLEKAQRDMQESQRVAMVKTEVETALKNAEQSIHLTLGNPETSYSIASRIIQVNPHIIGVGVAFIPDYYKDKGKNGLFLPYTYDDQPNISNKGKRTGSLFLRTQQMVNFDYTQRDWFKTAIAGKSEWTEAYVGEGSNNVLMCTYSIPIKEKNGRIVGALFADVSMEDATVMMSKMNMGIRKGGIITLFIQIISLLLMAFIVWRAVVASRNYKERYIDPEKTQLIEKMEKMRVVNNRLTKRNQELAQKVSDLQSQLNSPSRQANDQHWFG